MDRMQMVQKKGKQMMSRRATYRILVLLLVITIVFASLLCGCESADSDNSLRTCEYTSFGEDITEQVKADAQAGNALLLEDSEYRLVMDENGVLKVLDNSDTVMWSTGVVNTDGSYPDEYLASSTLRYHSSDNSFQTVNAYADSYNKEQYRFYRDGETLVHEQIIGDYTGSLLMPEALTEERFVLFTSQMSERDASYIMQQYALFTAKDAPEDILKKMPGISQTPLYVLMNSTGHVRRNRIHAAFTSVGYTSDDLKADRNVAGMQGVQSIVFKLVTKYRFENGDLIMDVPCEELIWPESNALTSIELMKYGSLAAAGSTGSYIVPSGSGAQFDFVPNKAANYSLQFDGQDYSDTLTEKEWDYSGHPVFGVLRENVGNVAIIEEGSEAVRLRIETVHDGYIQYPEVVVNSYQSTTLGSGTPFYLFTDKAYSGNIRIRYCFLKGKEATYSGMAKRYGDYLERIGSFSGKQVEEDLPFEMEVIHSILVEEELFGITYDLERATTTFQETQNMLEWFAEQGVENIWVKLNGANKNGLFVQNPGSFTISKKAGGKKDYANLLEYCQKEGVQSFLQVNIPFHFADKWNDGYSPDKETARQLDKSLVQLYLEEKSTNEYRSDLPLLEVVSPGNYLKYAKEYVAASDLLGNGLSVGELARILNSDFSSKKSILRGETKTAVKDCLNELSGTYTLLAENPSAYTLSSLYALEKLPLGSSQYNYFERDIPLIPLALHGRIMYTSTYWNNQPSMQKARLKAIEYGSGIAYRFAQDIGKEDVVDQNAFLYNVDYELLKETALSGYQYVEEALSGLSNVKMKEHVYLSDTVVRVLYENGTAIYINYGNETAVVDGVSIEANSYLRK